MDLVKLQEFVRDGKIGPIAPDYLRIFIGEANWEDQIRLVFDMLRKKHTNTTDVLREHTAFAILLPTVDRSAPIEVERYLSAVINGYYRSQQSVRDDWTAVLKQVVEKDIENQEHKKAIVSLGVIDPIEYQPYTREAFNRMFEKAEQSGAVTADSKDMLVKRLKNLVMVYGGAVISNIFTRHPDAIDKIVNWRTGYFIERAIFNVYSPDQILKIKAKELQQTNAKLIKKIRID